MYDNVGSRIQKSNDVELIIAAYKMKELFSKIQKVQPKMFLEKTTLESFTQRCKGGISLITMESISQHGCANGGYIAPPSTFRSNMSQPMMGALWGKSIVGNLHSDRDEMDRLSGTFLSTVLDQSVEEDANALEFGNGKGFTTWYLLNRSKNPQLQEITVATKIPNQSAGQSVEDYVKYRSEESAKMNYERALYYEPFYDPEKKRWCMQPRNQHLDT